MLVWLCAFTSLGIALYAAITYDLHRWSTGLTSISALMVGIYNLGSLEYGDSQTRQGGRLFVVAVLIFATGTLTAYVS